MVKEETPVWRSSGKSQSQCQMLSGQRGSEKKCREKGGGGGRKTEAAV